MTPEELYELIVTKWGKSYDLQVRRIQGTIYVQVMWKYLEQASFPLTDEEYFERITLVANYINGWNSAIAVRSFIEETKERPRLGKAVSIPIDLGGRESEWDV
jgi:Domain of unknown function (DUF3067)